MIVLSTVVLKHVNSSRAINKITYLFDCQSQLSRFLSHNKMNNIRL